MDNQDLFREFAGCLVRITDDSGNEIGIGKLDENGVVHAVIDGVEYTQQLSNLEMGD
jgi:hypothetical protein